MKSANAIHRLLFKCFKPYMVHLAVRDLPSPSPIKLEFAFQDARGARWFVPCEMPILRKLYITNAFTQVYTGIHERDISASAEAIQKAINEKSGGKMRPNIAMVSHICVQLLSRAGYVIHPEALYELAAMYYIREGERVEIVDSDLIPDKVAALKEVPGQIEKFFLSQSLEKLFPWLNDYEGTLAEAIEACKVETQEYLTNMQRFIKNG